MTSALVLRRKGKSFAEIAVALGLADAEQGRAAVRMTPHDHVFPKRPSWSKLGWHVFVCTVCDAERCQREPRIV